MGSGQSKKPSNNNNNNNSVVVINNETQRNCNNNNNENLLTSDSLVSRTLTTSSTSSTNLINSNNSSEINDKFTNENLINNLIKNKKMENNKEEEQKQEQQQNQTLDEFKMELQKKREQRQTAVATMKSEIINLRKLLEEEKKLTKNLKEKYEPNQISADDVKSDDVNLCRENFVDVGGGSSGDCEEGTTSTVNQCEISETFCDSEFLILNSNEHNQNVNVLTQQQQHQQNENITVEEQSDVCEKCSCSEKLNDLKSSRKEIAEIQLTLQLANTEILTVNSELDVTRKQVNSLKEIIAIHKKMIVIREDEVTQLKTKLNEIEESLAERELKIMSNDLRVEYDRQLENIKNLKLLYEERARVFVIERDNIKRELETTKTNLDGEIEKNKNLNQLFVELQDDLKRTSNELSETQIKLSSMNLRKKQLECEMSTINQLSSQILMGFNSGNNIDIDKLAEVLEENRGLLNDITVGEVSVEGASDLPKLLFDLCVQADNSSTSKLTNAVTNNTNDDNHDHDDEIVATTSITDGGCGGGDDNLVDASHQQHQQESENKKYEKINNFASAEEIVGNLPKVWRVLMEFLSHHKVMEVPIENKLKIDNNNDCSSGSGSSSCNNNIDSGDCYKSVQTPSGPELVISVSKTFIKLKDLILEKKSLQKETNRLKTLNEHLDKRLQSQEKRLGVVTVELTKTWHLVGKMQRQHRQLHTHEQILRYQLQQKRRMLNELKEELEYCRKKWAMAKQKNNDTEIQWKLLQCEFANRKIQDSLCNSGESGYSDDTDDDDDDDNDDDNNVNDNKNENGGECSTTNKKSTSENKKKNKKIQQFSRTNNEIKTEVENIPQSIELFQNIEEIIINDDCNEIIIDDNIIVDDDNDDDDDDQIIQLTAAEQISNRHREHFIAGTIEVPEILMTPTIISQLTVNQQQQQQEQQQQQPSTSSGSGTSKLLSLSTKKKITFSENQKGGETIEEMFMRLNSLPIPSTELQSQLSSSSSSNEESALECKVEINDVSSLCVNERPESNEILPSSLTSTAPLEETSSIVSTSSTPIIVPPSKSDSSDVSTSTSSTSTTGKSLLTLTEEEYTARRAARLKRLEEQCQQLLSNVTNTVNRGDIMNSQLDQLHGRFGKNSRSNTIDETEIETLVTTGDNAEVVDVTAFNQQSSNIEIEGGGSSSASNFSVDTTVVENTKITETANSDDVKIEEEIVNLESKNDTDETDGNLDGDEVVSEEEANITIADDKRNH